jgi:hypothetical protein
MDFDAAGLALSYVDRAVSIQPDLHWRRWCKSRRRFRTNGKRSAQYLLATTPPACCKGRRRCKL